MKVQSGFEVRLQEDDSNLAHIRNEDVLKRKLGLTKNEHGGVDICVWAPYANKVELVFKENESPVELHKQDRGYWIASSEKISEYTLYKFRINGKEELSDPVSLSQPDGVHGYSSFIDLSHFPWTDHTYSAISPEKYIIYELHTGTFTPEGTFAAIEEKLDYLLELGINTIELMPVAQFPGNRNWGYDGVYPFAVQNSYGGARALQHLVNACHHKGIAVILDVVYNHLGPEGNYLASFGPYFTDKYKTPWGSAINFDDAWCDGVRHYFIENALMWFRDFHIDALRLDAVHAIKDFSPVHILREIKHYTDALIQSTGQAHYLIVEVDLNDTRYINPIKEGGYGMDAQWIDEFHHALRVAAGQERNGYYADFHGIEHLAKAYKDAYVYDGIYSPHRYRTFGVKADHNPGEQFVVFSQNHDQVGNRLMGERTSSLVSFEMQKLLAGAVLISPFIPLLFMGEEYAEPNPFQYFISHGDPQLVEAVRKGRKAEFAAFHANGVAPDPQSEDTFIHSRLQWQLPQTEPHLTMLRYYQHLVAIRKKTKALSVLDRKNVDVLLNSAQQTLLLHRWYEAQDVVALMNFSREQQLITLPAISMQWQKLIASSDRQWKGPAHSSEFCKGGSNILIHPESIVIYVNSRHD